MENQIFSEAGKDIKFAWIFALLWNAFIGYAMTVGAENILKAVEDDPIFYFIFMFPLIGVLIIILAIKKTISWYKFGKTPLILTPFPAQVGGYCDGYIDLPKSTSQATVALVCIHHYFSRNTDNESRWESEPVWQDSISIKQEYHEAKGRLKFAFNPPKNLPLSEEKSNDYHSWKLHIKMPYSGIDFDRHFIIPLEESDSQSPVKSQQSRLSNLSTAYSQQDKKQTIPQITSTLSGSQFYYHSGRSKLMAFILAGMGIGVGFLGYSFLDMFYDFLPLTNSLMSLCIGAIGLALIALAVAIVASDLTVEVGVAGIRKQQRAFGFSLKEKFYANTIVDITIEKNGSYSSGNTTCVWYKLSVLDNNGMETLVGEDLEGYSYAENIRQQMISCLGVNWQPATNHTPAVEKPKRPLPDWLKLTAKLSPYSFLIALVVDIALGLPQVNDTFYQAVDFLSSIMHGVT